MTVEQAGEPHETNRTAVGVILGLILALFAVGMLFGGDGDARRPPAARAAHDSEDMFGPALTADELRAQAKRSRRPLAWVGPAGRGHVLRVGRGSLGHGRLALGYAEQANGNVSDPFMVIVTLPLTARQTRAAVRQARTSRAQVRRHGRRLIVLPPRNFHSNDAFLIDPPRRLIVRIHHVNPSRHLLRKLAERVRYINHKRS